MKWEGRQTNDCDTDFLDEPGRLSKSNDSGYQYVSVRLLSGRIREPYEIYLNIVPHSSTNSCCGFKEATSYNLSFHSFICGTVVILVTDFVSPLWILKWKRLVFCRFMSDPLQFLQIHPSIPVSFFKINIMGSDQTLYWHN